MWWWRRRPRLPPLPSPSLLLSTIAVVTVAAATWLRQHAASLLALWCLTWASVACGGTPIARGADHHTAATVNTTTTPTVTQGWRRRPQQLVKQGSLLTPRIFVYDLPDRLGAGVLRRGGPACLPNWHHHHDDAQAGSGGGSGGGGFNWHAMYTTEVAIYEAIQRSAHRTLDPSAADLFFIPAFAACHLHTVALNGGATAAGSGNAGDEPNSSNNNGKCNGDNDSGGCSDDGGGHDNDDNRSSSGGSTPAVINFSATADYLAATVAHVRAAQPYFNASGGADHFLVLSHDLGRCLLGQHRHRQSHRAGGGPDGDGGGGGGGCGGEDDIFGATFALTATGDLDARPNHYAAYVGLYHNDDSGGGGGGGGGGGSSSGDARSRRTASAGRPPEPGGAPSFFYGLREPCFDPARDIVIPPATGIVLVPGKAERGSAGGVGREGDCADGEQQRLLLVAEGGSGASAAALRFAAPPHSAFSRRKLCVFRGAVYGDGSPHSFGSRQRLLRWAYNGSGGGGGGSAVSVTASFPPPVPCPAARVCGVAGRSRGGGDDGSIDCSHSSDGGDGADNGGTGGGAAARTPITTVAAATAATTYRRAYLLEMLNARFCLCLPGFAPWTARLFEAVLLGCVPVVLSEPRNALPFSAEAATMTTTTATPTTTEDAAAATQATRSSGARSGSSGGLPRGDAAHDSVVSGGGSADGHPLAEDLGFLAVDWARDVAVVIDPADLDGDRLHALLRAVPPADLARRQRNMLRMRKMLVYFPPSPSASTPATADDSGTSNIDGGNAGERGAMAAIFEQLRRRAESLRARSNTCEQTATNTAG